MYSSSSYHPPGSPSRYTSTHYHHHRDEMILLSTLLALTLLDPAHVHAKHRSHIPVRVDESQLPSPKGPLVWGDVNFIQTTDIHGKSYSPGWHMAYDRVERAGADPYSNLNRVLDPRRSIGWLLGHQHVSQIGSSFFYGKQYPYSNPRYRFRFRPRMTSSSSSLFGSEI